MDIVDHETNQRVADDGEAAPFGIGPSAVLARCAALLFARAGRRGLILDAAGIALADQMLDLRAGDAVLALAYGRAYREVRGCSRRRGGWGFRSC